MALLGSGEEDVTRDLLDRGGVGLSPMDKGRDGTSCGGVLQGETPGGGVQFSKFLSTEGREISSRTHQLPAGAGLALADRLATPLDGTSGLCSGDFEQDRRDGPSSHRRGAGSQKSEGRQLHVDGSAVAGMVSSLQGKPFSSVMPLVESLLIQCCSRLGFGMRGKAKPTGNVFPLPTSIDSLLGVVGNDKGTLFMMRCLCMALNNYAGEALEGPLVVNQLHRELLHELSQDVASVGEWSATFGELSWESFFRSRGVDYTGEEVASAKYTSWNNLRSAIPSQVGTVELASVLDGGCHHYVTHFEEYLLPCQDQEFTKAPRVMVYDSEWDQVCQGLLDSGICRLIAEEELYRVSGQPLLNGMFGVEKGEVDGVYPVHRLIMNLIPLNGICRGMQGDIATLPSWASMGPLALMPTEQLLISSEDVRCFFYIFKVPIQWHKFLGFNKEVPDRFKAGRSGKVYLCSTVLPMGFCNSVSLAQAVQRCVVGKASERIPGLMSGEQELRKDKPFPRTRLMYRVYLDNYDELERCDSKLAGILRGDPSPTILALRAEYEHWGIPRHPKKSVQRQDVAEVQGALVNGSLGTAIPKPEKILKYTPASPFLHHSKTLFAKTDAGDCWGASVY